MTGDRDDMLQRIVRDAGVPDLVDVLADRLSPADLSSLLLEVFRRRAAWYSQKMQRLPFW